MSPAVLANLKPRFPIWEVVLVVLIVLVATVFFVFRSGDNGAETTYEPINGQDQEAVSLNEPVIDPLSPAERAAALETLNEPVEDPLTPAERAAAIEELNQPSNN